MKLDVPTLVFMLSLTLVTQVIAVFIQQRVHRTCRGIGWWLVGSALMALGFIVLALGKVEYVRVLATIGNPLLVLGRICLLVGILRFVEKPINFWLIGSMFVSFLILYYFYLFGHADMAMRTVVVSAAIAAYSWMIGHRLLFNSPKSIRGSARFTGATFLVHGGYLIVVIGDTLLSGPIHSYVEYSPVQVSAFVIPAITSLLWTFGFILMVNQRLHAENLEERENLQQVFNISPDAALITRLADGLIVDANCGFSVLSGHSHSEIVGSRSHDLNLWCDPADQASFIAEMKRNRSCENVESTFQRKDGSRLTGMTSARILTMDDQPYIVSVTRDITEQKRAEEALRESEETYRSILKASPDDITITDLDGRILIVSPAAYTMFGFEQGEAEGRQLLEFVVPEDQERARANILHLHHGGPPRPNEYRGIRKDRSLVDIEVNSGLIRGVNRQPVKMVFVVRDITERKKAELEKEALESRNQQCLKAESLGRMAGAIAHHFNNQLQTVLGSLELLSGLPNITDHLRWLSSARQAAERAAEVSRLMLAYLGQASHEHEPKFLAELCQSSLSVLQGTMPGIVRVEADFPAPGPIVSTNPTQIQQLLTNLITNAWEALGERKGSIRLGLRTCRVEEISTVHRFPINWQPQEQEYACLEVKDTGCGIAEVDIEKLFDPFFSTKFIGRGLGLSAVLGIVQAHGGAVTVESRLGQGSTFRIHFPLCRAEGARPTQREVQAGTIGGTILLVDDEELLLLSTGAVLEMLGFTVLTAKDGVEAMEVFHRHRDQIRCVITDLTMPRMDGWETLAALRLLEPTLPVILMSGYDQAQVMAGTHPVRPNGFLSKPFGQQSLRGIIEQVLLAGGTELH